MLKPKKNEIQMKKMNELETLPNHYTQQKYVNYDEALDLKNMNTNANIEFLESRIKKIQKK